MLSSCVLSIGKEIISGIINDTNSFYIASRLSAFGIYNRYIVSLDDIKDEIEDGMLHYLDRVDILITTGGLGPTFDDITLFSVASALNKKLIFSKNAYNHIKQFYDSLYKTGKIKSNEMNDKRKKMAYLPENAIELYNSTGAAFGAYINEKGKRIFCLPGIPKEMKPMFDNEVLPIIKQLSTGVTISKTYEFSINDETLLGQFIDKIKNSDVYIKSLPTGFDSKSMGVRFTASGNNEFECLKKIELAKNRLADAINGNV